MLHTWERGNAYKILSENPKGRDHIKDVGVDGKVILEWPPLPPVS
jgi:hypothetical protein